MNTAISITQYMLQPYFKYQCTVLALPFPKAYKLGKILEGKPSRQNKKCLS